VPRVITLVAVQQFPFPNSDGSGARDSSGTGGRIGSEGLEIEKDFRAKRGLIGLREHAPLVEAVERGNFAVAGRAWASSGVIREVKPRNAADDGGQPIGDVHYFVRNGSVEARMDARAAEECDAADATFERRRLAAAQRVVVSTDHRLSAIVSG